MANVEMWFPVTIYKEDHVISQFDNNLLKDHCLNLRKNVPQGGADWLGGTYNTHGTHDVSKDEKFKYVIDEITKHVNAFAKMHGCDGTYASYYAWINIAEKGNYQEFHSHNSNVFSAVYYIGAPEGSGRIVFEDPKEPDMYCLKSIKEKNELSFTRISYPAEEGTLLVFRSYLRHLVEPGINESPRISLALNFK